MFFDSHTHIQFSAFGEDYKEVIARALASGVGLVNVGTQRDTSKRAIEIAHEFENEPVYATVGLHPIHTEKSFHDAQELGIGEKAQEFTSRGEQFDFDYYKKLAEDKKVLAIGECGLDYYHLGDETKKKQAEVFIAQIEVAKAVGKPLMVHCRNAFPDLIQLLTTHYSLLPTPHPGIAHFFTGTVDDAKQLLALGFSFSFGGAITFPPRKGKTEGDYDAAIKYIPVDRILSETDAPYVAPALHRGKRNEPAYVIEVVERLAWLKGVQPEEMKAQIRENAKNVFGV